MGRIVAADSALDRLVRQRFLPDNGIIQKARPTGPSKAERQMASKTTNPFTFLQQVRSETAKVTWPSRRETMISTVMVLVFAVIAMIFFFAADQLMAFADRADPRHRPLRPAITENSEMTARWYIVHAYSNFEKKVAEDIENKAKQKGLSDQIEQIVVPTEKVVEVRRGRKVDAERKFFPGYVLVAANLTDAVFSA